MGDSTVLSVLEIMCSSSFDLNVFKKHVKGLFDCREIALFEVERSYVETEFEKKFVEKSEKEFTGEVAVFKRYGIEVLQNQVSHASERDNMMFFSDE